MGIDTPVMGVLWQNGKSSPDDIPGQPGAVLETELGYSLAQSISQPITEADLSGLISHVSPMIEIAHPNLNTSGGLAFIATNSASYRFIQGSAQAFPDNAFAALDVTEAALNNAQDRLFAGPLGSVLSGQASALCWLINQTLACGYPLQAGHLLMTGSVGVAGAKNAAASPRSNCPTAMVAKC